mgnify:CR=1 FL=1
MKTNHPLLNVGVLIILLGMSFFPALFSLGWQMWLFLLGASVGGQFLIFTLNSLSYAKNIAATAGSLLNAICMTSGFVLQPLMGKLLDWAMFKPHPYIWGMAPLWICAFVAYGISYGMSWTQDVRSEG